jgi:uncharacterized membrane protein YfhO
MVNKKGQSIQWPINNDIQYNGQQTMTDDTMVNKLVGHCIVCPCLLTIVLSVLVCWPLYCLSLFVGHCIVCPCLLAIVLFVLFCCPYNTMVNKQGQTIQWSTNKDRQYNGQQKRTNNTMANKQGQTI